MAFRDLDKSTQKPFSDKKPDNFVQEKPFLDSDIENQVWDDISKLGGKQIAREEIDLIYRAFADKLESISAEIESLKSSQTSSESIDAIDKANEKFGELVDSEKEVSENVDSAISAIDDLSNMTKIDGDLGEIPSNLDEKLLSSIYEKIVKSIFSPSILIPFITKISEKIYDSITQSSSKIFNELNKEFKEQLNVDILGDIKDIAKAKDLKLIGADKSDEEAIKRIASEEKKRKEKEQKDKDKNSKKDNNEDEKENEEKSKPKATQDELEEARKKKQSNGQQQSDEEEQKTKKSFTSIREALIATADSMNVSNQKIKKIWDDALKMNDLEEYSITSGKDDEKSKDKKDSKKKEEQDNRNDEKNSSLGKFALIGALAACYFLFKYQSGQSHIQKYIESHPPMSRIEKDISDTVETGISDIEGNIQRELEKNGDSLQQSQEQQEPRSTTEEEKLIEAASPEIDKKTEEFGNAAIESSIDDYEKAKDNEDAETAKQIEKYVFNASKESQEQLDKFLEENKLKNTAVEKEIEKRKIEAQEVGEEFQIEIEKIQKQTKRAEREVREFTSEEEKKRSHDKSITDAASGLIMTETDVIVRQHDEILSRVRIEEQMVENSKKKDELVAKAIYDHVEETEENMENYHRSLEEALKKDPDALKKVRKARERALANIGKSGIGVNTYIDSVFEKLQEAMKTNEKDNGVIEAATDENKYVIIGMDSYQKMLFSILGIGTRTSDLDDFITAKIGPGYLRPSMT